ncbi:MAG: hypothetical protein HQ517_13475 [SAR324 cluster bacterium]|nr:hypothetical protein [SAR324 cluster bacterium]
MIDLGRRRFRTAPEKEFPSCWDRCERQSRLNPITAEDGFAPKTLFSGKKQLDLFSHVSKLLAEKDRFGIICAKPL